MYASAKLLAILVRALSAAKTAVEAAHAFYQELTLLPQALGVVTPDATQGASLHKYGRSYAVSVVKGKLLDVKDKPLHQTVYSWREIT